MLKKLILLFKTRKNLKHYVTTSGVDFKSSRKIAILYSEHFDKESDLMAIIHELKQCGKEVSVLIFYLESKVPGSSLPHFSKTDISWTGESKSDELAFFLGQSFDFAICLDTSQHFLVDYVFSSLKAKCRVGLLSDVRAPFFDLMIQGHLKKESLSEVILKYLKMIHHEGNETL